MSVTKRYGLYGVEVDATLIGGVTQQEIPTGTTVRGEAPSDQVFPEIVSVVSQKPTVQFQTLDVARALGVIGPLGLAIASLETGLKLYARKHQDGGDRAGAGQHRKYTVRKGILIPRTLTADHQADAELSVDAVITYDGVNDPVAITDAANVPAGLTNDRRYTMGPATIAGLALTGRTGVSIEFGLNVEAESADGDIWDTEVSIVSIMPRIVVRGIDPTWLAAAAIPLLGKAGTHANTAFYLKRRVHGGTFATGSAHCRFTADATWYVDPAFSAQDHNAAGVTLIGVCRHDGTNSPIVFADGVALP